MNFNKPTCNYPINKINPKGIRNPFYTCVDWYVMTNPPQKGPAVPINRCELEPYYADFIEPVFVENAKLNVDIREYYNRIVVMLRAAYYDLRKKGIMYSNLSPHDSAILVIRRVLDQLGVCQNEILKISQLFDLRLLEVDNIIETVC